MERGAIIGGRFEVLGEAGRGGMGVVVRARDTHAGGEVAVKLVPVADPIAAERFAREAVLLATLSHPAIVRYVAHGALPGGTAYLAMEWLDGETLAERLARGALSVAEAVALARRVAEALAEAHARGVVHRDLKPANLFLAGGELERVKVLDFGVARVTGELSRSRGPLGTPGYVAPEQARGEAAIGPAADVFALGCVLYECLAARPAFSAGDLIALLAKILVDEPQPLRDLRSDVPAAVERILGLMLGKDPARRYTGGAEAAAALAEVEAGLGGAPRRTSLAQAAVQAGEVRFVSVLLAGPPPRGSAASDDQARSVLAGFGAAVERLAGGTLLATLSAGGGAGDQAARGARAALALRQALPGRALVVATGRAGLNYGRPGPAEPGREDAPAAHRSDGRLPVGEVIDRGARALAAVPAGSIGVCDVTAALLGARFEVVPGPRGPLLAGERTDVGIRTLLGRPVPCVGRDRELATLAGTFAECSAESVARAVLITAPPGQGKTRLLGEFLRRLEQGEPPTILIGRGDSLSAGSPFGLLAQAVRRAAGIAPGEPVEDRRRKLAARVASWVAPADARRVTELLGEMCGVPFPDEDNEPLRAARGDAQLMGDAMRAAWEDWLRAECAAAPVLLVLDDLHWGDLPTVKFVDHALRALAGAPIFVLALARPEIDTLFPQLWVERDLITIRLPPLTRKAALRLVREALGAQTTDEVAEGLVARAEGNAFYLEELIRTVAAGAHTAAARPVGLPETVLGTVQARLDALPAEARRVLRAASVFGAHVPRGGVAELLGGDQRTAEEWLDDLAAREILHRRPGGPYSFRHELVREAAYAMLPDADRRHAHQLAGEWLENRGEPDPAILAEHFDRGGDTARAAVWILRAATQALEGNDLAAAVARADRGLALIPSGPELGPLLLVKAEALRWRSDPIGAARHAELAAGELPSGRIDWFQAVGELIVSSGRLGRNDRVEEWAHRAAAAPAEPGAESAKLSCLCRGAAQLVQAGLHAGADPILEHAHALAAGGASIDHLAAARLHRVRAKRALHRGDVAGFLSGQEEAAAAFERAGDTRNACSERGDLGFAYLEVGDLDKAEEVLHEVVATAERFGLQQVIPWAWNNLGTVLCHRGRTREAADVEQRAIDAGVTHADRRLEGGSRINLSIIRYRAGDYAAAEREAALAVDLLEPAPPRRAAALASLARAMLAQRRIGEARGPIEEAMETLASLGGLDEGESLVRLVHVEWLRANADPLAAAAVDAARARIHARAGLITDLRLRACFLALPDNAALLAD